MIELRPYLIAPYLDGGRDLVTGVDCWGTVRAFYAREFGIELPAFSDEYDSSENEGSVAQLVAREAKAGNFHRVLTPELGDVVRMWWRRKDEPSHVGIYLGNSQMLHARKGGVMVDSLEDDFFAMRVVDYWRHNSRLPSWDLAVSTNPLSDDFVTIAVPAGTTILEALAAANVRRDRDGGSIRVVLGGDPIPPDWWARIRPKAGQLVSAQSVPGWFLLAFFSVYGSYVATALTVLSIAYQVYAYITAPPPPKNPAGAIGPDQSPLAAGTGNQMERWAKVAVGYGTMRVYPHLAAPAWTEIVGQDRYWRILLCVGAGRYQIDQTETLGRTGIEVGGVPIEDLPNADWEIFEGGGTRTYDDTVLDVEPVDDSPSGYWTLSDAASPALNSIAGGPSLAQGGGAVFNGASILDGQTNGASVLLDGVNDYLEATTNLPLGDLSGDWTVECWVRFSRDNQAGDYAAVLSIGNYGDGVAIFAKKSDDAFIVTLGGIGESRLIQPIGVGLKTWHLVIRRKASALTFWANAINTETLSVATPIAPTSRFTVGSQHNGTVRAFYFSGSVERVALYDVALSDDEIRLHYDLGFGGSYKSRILVDHPNEKPINEAITPPSVLDGEWWFGKWITREIDSVSDELSAELFFPGGLYRIALKGYTSHAFLGIDLEYKEQNGTTWMSASKAEMGGRAYGPDGQGGWSFVDPTGTWQSGSLPSEYPPNATPTNDRSFYIQGNGRKSLLIGFRWKVPNGVYSIRLRHWAAMPMRDRGGGSNTAAFIGDFLILAFRGTKHYERPVRTDKVSLVGVYLPVKETGGTVNQISLLRRRMVKTYAPNDPLADGDGMTPERVTDNAAWSYLDWLTNPDVNSRPVALSKINLPAIADFATRAKPCHLEIDFAGNVWDTAGMILGPSFASIGYAASKWTVVEDRSGKTLRQLLTARNGSGWQWAKHFVDVPHAYRVSILDEANGYQDLEVLVFDDPYNEDGSAGKVAATIYQTLDPRGITNRDQAIEYGKRLLRILRLRHEEFSTEVLFESLTAKRGDLVLANIPTALIGQRAGTIIKVEVNLSGLATAFLIDELVTYGVGVSYGCRFRIVDPAVATQYAIIQADVTNPATTVSIEQRRLTFTTPIPVINVPPVGALIAFGERGEEAQECLIRDIQRKPGFVAALTLIPYSPAIFNPIDEPAVFEPIIEDPVPLPQLLVPLPPTILRIDSDEDYLAFTPAGIQVRMRVIVQPARGRQRALAAVTQARARDTSIYAGQGGWIYSDWNESYPATHWIGPLSESTYVVQARSATAAGVASTWSTPVHHTVIGQSTPPPDVVEVRRESDLIAWNYPNPPRDFDGFLVRYRYGKQSNGPWSAAHPAHVGVLHGNSFPLSNLPNIVSPLTVSVKAVDYAGHESTNAATVVIYRSGINPTNVLLTIDHRGMGWPGSKTDCAVDGGDLAVDQEAGDDTQPMWTDDTTRMWSADPDDLMWTSPFSKLAYYVAGWTPSAEAVGKRLVLDYDFAPLDANLMIEYRGHGVNQMWGADTDAMWTTDATRMWVGFGEWNPWPGELLSPTRKGYQWRVTMNPMRAGRPRLTKFQIISDVDDRRLVINDFVVSAAGSRLPVGEPFHVISFVSLTKQDIPGETVAKLLLADRQPYGPLVYAFDSSNVLVSATIDAEVVGY